MAIQRIYWSQLAWINQTLFRIIHEGKHISTEISKIIQDKKRGVQDRNTMISMLYDIIKNYRYYYYLAYGTDQNDKDPIEVAAVYLFEHNIQLVARDFQINYDLEEINIRKNEIQARPEILYSMPTWINALGQHHYADDWPKLMKVLVEKAPVFIRINTLVTNLPSVSSWLKECNIVHEICGETSIKIDTNIDLSQTLPFKSGWFEFQDMGSQIIGSFCNARPKEVVIDACAGAGGKTLAMAMNMANQGSILALDIQNQALNQLKLRALRSKAKNITVFHYDHIDINTLNGSADLVLCDVPCSGSGVFRRDVDQKWRLNSTRLNDLVSIQAEILDKAIKWLKPKGRLVYATCSIFKEENQHQVKNFLAAHPDFILDEERILLPTHEGHDGFYMARIIHR